MLFFQTLRRARTTFSILSALSLSVIGCSTTPSKPTPELSPLDVTQIEDSLSFEQETLYALIAAEIGLVRDRYELGLNNYVQQARSTQDVNIAARAAQVARVLRRHPESLEMAELWHKLNPSSQEARFILVSEYTFAERFQEAFIQADRLLQAGYVAGFDDIAIDAARKDHNSIKALSDKFQIRLAQYPDNVELLIGQSILQQKLGEPETALQLIDRAIKQSPDSLRASYQRFRVLTSLKRDEEATQTYARLVELQPNNKRTRNAYAHLLVKYDVDAAREQYQILHEQSPNDMDVLLNLALLQLEQKMFSEANVNFTRLIEEGQHLSTSHFGLGEAARSQEKYEEAIRHYSLVKEGPRFVEASSQAANLIKEARSAEEALTFIQKRRDIATNPDKESLFIIEASALSNAGAQNRSIQVLTNGLNVFPSSVKLNYSRAMQYASMNETALAEVDFKYVLSLVPDNAATLNALGYTLLEQTDRIEEAGQYIRKALEVESQDAAILDSMGWYEFKRGNIKVALNYLQQAFEQYPDDEIAAHLGEALWSINKKRRAKSIWKQGFEESPNSKVILDTLERLNIEWP